MTEVSLLLIFVIVLLGLQVWMQLRANKLYDAVGRLQEARAAIADGRATVYRHNDHIIVTHKEG